jgi:hypothetical protein
MTEWQIAGILIYLVIGYLIADTFLVKVNNAYWTTLFFYPIIIAGFFIIMLLLIILIKLWEFKGWVLNESRI